MNYLINRALMQVEYDMSDGVCDLMDDHGQKTDHNRPICGVSVSRDGRETI